MAAPQVAVGESADVRVRAMIARHYDLVWRSLVRLGVPRSEVDDAAQQVFIVAARKLDTLEARGERAYVLGIAVRVAADARRTVMRRRETAAPDEDPRLDPTPLADDLVERKRARQMLDRVMDTLPHDLRAPFALFELEGLTIHEVAEALGVPVGTASSRLRRARGLFHERVADLVTSSEASNAGSGRPS